LGDKALQESAAEEKEEVKETQPVLLEDYSGKHEIDAIARCLNEIVDDDE